MNRFSRTIIALTALCWALASQALAQQITPGFTAVSDVAQITATSGAGITATLPAGPVIVVTNTGTSNAAYCLMGATADTNAQYIATGSWFAFQRVSGLTQITCVTVSSTTTLNLVGGVGLPTGSGGGGGGGGGGGTSSAFGAAFPGNGTAIGVKNGANMVNLTADGSSNLNVNCAVGCAGGSTSNASSGVATSSTNGATVAWLYGFNGTTWDQLQVDGSKFLKVIAQTGSTTAATQATAANLNATVIGAGSAGTANAGVVTVQGIASMTKLLVTPDSVALPANQSVNEAQINGVTPLMGNGVTGTGSQRVTIASDNTAIAGVGAAATAGAVPANAVYQGVSSSGGLTGSVGCDSHTFKHITSATDTLLVQGVTAKIIKICGVKTNFTGSAAQSIFIENTASTNANCSSSNTQIGPLITGSSTVPFSDGFYSPIWGGFANTSANGVCVNSSGTGVVDVEIWYTQGS